MIRKNVHQRIFLTPQGEMPEWLIEPELLIKSLNPVNEQIVRLIVERAAGIRRPESFGSANDFDAIGCESLLPSLTRVEIPESQPRVLIGSPQCLQPYAASLLNASALSFGPMGKPFIMALNQAAYQCGFFQNTGEAGLSPYHFGVDLDIEAPNFNVDQFFKDLATGYYPQLQEAGDLVWQIGTGYFGCRNAEGEFDAEQFKLKAALSNVKMIELKLSQGVEPCKNMPVKQVTLGMTRLMGIDGEQKAKLQDQHSAFSSPVELLKFVAQLRKLSKGKPIGLKMGISHRHYFLAICKAMLKTNILLDFITIDGMEAGTAAGPKGASGFTGTSLNEALLFAHNALVGTNLRPHIKLIASGKMFTEQAMISKFARGADLCATARGMLLAVGCDQQRECYNGACKQGLATQDPILLSQFNIPKNAQRLQNYHQLTIQEVKELFGIAGVSGSEQITPYHLQMRVSISEVRLLSEIYAFLKPGALLNPLPWLIPKEYKQAWALANPNDTFLELLNRQISSSGRSG